MVITTEEMALADYCLEKILDCGASQARVSLSKSTLDSVVLLNGEVDKVSRCADRSLYLYLFVDGRYGTCSTNRLEKDEIDTLVEKSVENVRLLAPDPARRLPDPDRCAKDAVTGKETGLFDEDYGTISVQEKVKMAMRACAFGKCDSVCAGPEAENAGGKKDHAGGPEAAGEAGDAGGENGRGYRLISEECEYSDSVEDNYMIDSQGFRGRHSETTASFWSEVTIEDSDGNKLTGYSWTADISPKRLDLEGCADEAVAKAVARIGSGKTEGGRYNMVVDNYCSSRLFAPLLGALDGSAIQQQNSFLCGKLGEEVFGKRLTVRDLAREWGKPGARYFDTEGVATADRDIIHEGRIEMYFINTLNSIKMDMEPTIEGPSRPTVMPFVGKEGENLDYGKNDINLQAVLEYCRDGILVTGFNGGNCNPVTGFFSYGVEGFLFKDGKVVRPIKEMLITGDMVSLWRSLVAAGADARKGARWQVPTLAFENVEFR